MTSDSRKPAAFRTIDGDGSILYSLPAPSFSDPIVDFVGQSPRIHASTPNLQSALSHCHRKANCRVEANPFAYPYPYVADVADTK